MDIVLKSKDHAFDSFSTRIPLLENVYQTKVQSVRSLPRLNLFSFNNNKRSVFLIIYMSDLAELRYSIGYFGLFIQAK